VNLLSADFNRLAMVKKLREHAADLRGLSRLTCNSYDLI
jgi:hypothetical protein